MNPLNPVQLITLYRIFSAPALFYLAIKKKKTVFKWMLAISLFTDLIDGFLARKFKLESEQGAKLDSTGDMLTLISSISAFLVFHKNFAHKHKYPIGIAISLYSLQLIFSTFKYGKPSSFHTISAKIAAIIQGLFFLNTFFFKINKPLFYLTIVAGIIETLEETGITIILPEPRSNIKGIWRTV